MIVRKATTNGSAKETGRLMQEVVDFYYLDMAEYASLSLMEIYNLIKNISFREDPADCETLQRPLYTLNQRGLGGDCDDKAIALACWCKLNSIPYEFVAVRKFDRKEVHHVLLYIYIAGQWISCDPTYAFNTLGREREPYAEKVII